MKTGRYFYNCVFEACTFESSVLENVMFEGCHFINCIFYDVEVISTGTNEEESIFISCIGHERLSEELHQSISVGAKTDSNEQNFEKIVLEQFWMKGSNAAGSKENIQNFVQRCEAKR